MPKLDRYGCLLGKVQSGGRDVNLEQLRAGMAWYYRYYERDVFRDDRAVYNRVEREVWSEKRVLWADVKPTLPWDFRRGGEGRRGPPSSDASPGREADSSWEGAAGRTADRAPITAAVYVTRTGSKYHRDGCRYLSRSRIPISLRDAKAS